MLVVFGCHLKTHQKTFLNKKVKFAWILTFESLKLEGYVLVTLTSVVFMVLSCSQLSQDF